MPFCPGSPARINPDSKTTFRSRCTASARTIAIAITITLGSVVASIAQETQKPPDQPNPPDQPSPTIAQQVSNTALKPVDLFTLLDKKSIVFPDIASTREPISPGQKFQLFVDNSISVHTILWSGLGSAIGQASDSPTGWGQGSGAYFNRFGSSLARGASGEFFGTFVLASVLHEDPRFFPDRNPHFKQGLKYSLRRLFITRSDDGRKVANISGLLGPALGEGLANVYWPNRNRTVGDTFFRYGLDIAVRAGGNMFREYWPVLSRKIHSSSSAASAQH